MGAVLELMRQRGELGRDLKAVEWAGRTNDMKPVALQVQYAQHGVPCPSAPFACLIHCRYTFAKAALPHAYFYITRSC